MTLWLGAPKVNHNPTKSGGYRLSDSEDMMVLVSHMILKDHVIKWSYDVMGRTLSR